jgi:hypothetical protein
MMRHSLALLFALTATAHAWEPDTTHAGLTEQAALATRINAKLVALFGRPEGWLEPVVLGPERAPGLYKKLEVVEPSSGAVPDRRGRQGALGWLLAGSVVEGMPEARARKHFYDPVTKRGAAPDWIIAKDNDLGLERFWIELERAVSAPGPAERDEHLAMALVCAGAMVHVLEDMGVPARTRGDEDEFDLPLGGGPADRGSRFERLATLLDGRLGVPAPEAPVARPHARDFFTAADGKGLADLTNARWYSSGTLPHTVDVPRHPQRGEVLERVRAAQRYARPRPEHDLSLSTTDAVALRDERGVCLANYRVADEELRFFISDECAAEQLAAILPQVGGYAAGFLEWLFRGSLAVAVQDGQVLVTVPKGETPLGKGQVSVIAEDANGRRAVVGSSTWSGSAQVAAPSAYVRLFAVFRGTDESGDAVIAVGNTTAK